MKSKKIELHTQHWDKTTKQS